MLEIHPRVFQVAGEEAVKKTGDAECKYNLNVSNSLMSIIFTTHNILRQKQNSNNASNMQTKSSATDFPVTFKGKTYTIDRASSEAAWKKILNTNNLKYDVDKESSENWIGTMGPYLNMLGCWGLRLQELRVGHTKMPVARDGDKMNVVSIEKYGLSPAHAVHLEGVNLSSREESLNEYVIGGTFNCSLHAKDKG